MTYEENSSKEKMITFSQAFFLWYRSCKHSLIYNILIAINSAWFKWRLYLLGPSKSLFTYHLPNIVADCAQPAAQFPTTLMYILSRR